jgi:hypothetical protein
LYLPFEPGLKGVIEKFPKKDIFRPMQDGKPTDYLFARPVPKKDRAGVDFLESVQKMATPIWERFISDWHIALRDPKLRTIVIDTASAMYELGRFSFLGMAGKAAPKDDPFGQKSSAVKAIVRGLVQETYHYDKNIIFLAREKQVWKAGEPTDDFESDGWPGLPYEVQVVIRISKRTFAGKTVRKAVVIDSRLDGDFANGLVFSDTDGKDIVGPLNFVSIASTITGTDEKSWE